MYSANLANRRKAILYCMAAILSACFFTDMTEANAAPTVGTNIDMAGGVSGYQTEVAVAANPNNPQQLVGLAFTCNPGGTTNESCKNTQGNNLVAYASSDGGNTWTSTSPPLLGSGIAYDPAVAWDENGNVYLSYLSVSSMPSWSIYVMRSQDGGNTWQTYGAAISNSQTFEDKPLLAVDTSQNAQYSHSGRVYVIWDEGNGLNTTERVAFSDNGSTWTTVVVETNSGTVSDSFGDVVVGPDGTVYAVWTRYIKNSKNVVTGEVTVFSSSDNGGESWTSAVPIVSHYMLDTSAPFIDASNNRFISGYASIAVDSAPTSGYQGNLYVVYSDYPSANPKNTDSVNLYEIQSTNHGVTWSSPRQLNDDSGSASHFFGWVATDSSSGIVAVSWYDTRNDPNNRHAQTFMTYSANGGSSWAPNLLVTAASSQFHYGTINYYDESNDNANAGPIAYGDYAEIAIGGGIAHPIWIDTRNGNGDAATASVNLNLANSAVIIDIIITIIIL